MRHQGDRAHGGAGEQRYAERHYPEGNGADAAQDQGSTKRFEHDRLSFRRFAVLSLASQQVHPDGADHDIEEADHIGRYAGRGLDVQESHHVAGTMQVVPGRCRTVQDPQERRDLASNGRQSLRVLSSFV